jgi:hypothetical protein
MKEPGPNPGRKKPTERGTRARPAAAAAAPPKGNPALLYGGIGGGALLLIILVAVMSSGNEPPPKAAPKPKKEEPAAPTFTRPVKPDTGGIVFVCANSGKHEDEEVVVNSCPCGARKKFYIDKQAGGYRCLSCTQVFDNARLKCPKCDRTAIKTHLKPAFD